MAVEFRAITKSYGRKHVLKGLDLVVEPKSFTVLCGPPHAGKSVLFRILVGLEQADGGQVFLGGRDITDTPPATRPIGYVPQAFALYPHQTVAQNMAYPLTLAGAPKDEIARRVERTADTLSITHLLKKTPDQLSGGEKQRVAVARGLLKDAEIFVLDDPLVGLDYKLRERLMDELKSLRAELGATFLYATSDSLEALTMARSLAVIDAGRIVQHGETISVYDRPAHARTLDLVGFPHANLLPGSITEGTLSAGPLRAPARGVADGAVLAGIRPEALKLQPPEQVEAAPIDGVVSLVENLGGEAVVYVDAGGQSLTVALPLSGTLPPDLGSPVRLFVDPADIMLFDAASGLRIEGGHG